MLGSDPTTWGDATQFKTDPGKPGPWYEEGLSDDAHGSYFGKGSSGLQNMGRIIDGQEPGHK